MGQHTSKSSVEARVIFQRFGAEDIYERKDASSTPDPVVRFQKRGTTPGSRHHSFSRALEKAAPHSWPQSRRDAGGLVYVMDDPTGGVWVRPEERWTRS